MNLLKIFTPIGLLGTCLFFYHYDGMSSRKSIDLAPYFRIDTKDLKEVQEEVFRSEQSTTRQDSIRTSKSLNDIRFAGWDKSDWLDNEYIRTLRKYLDDYNSGKISNKDLDPYKEQIKGKFVVDDIRPDLLGGVFIRITFLDMPDRIFGSWIYSSVDEEKGVVESYELHSISIEEGRTHMTKEEILQIVKEVPELKLW